MGVLRTLPLTPPHGKFPSNFGVAESLSNRGGFISKSSQFRVLAKTEKGEKGDKEEPKKTKQSLFSSVTEALDFSQTRSAEDALLIEDAREATKSGEKMSREQYGALRRKIGGTYKDFFKSYVDVDGQYVEEGWVDKTCKVCKKDTGVSQGKWTNLEDTFMWRVWRNQNLATFLPDFSQDEDREHGAFIAYHISQSLTGDAM